MFPTIQVCILLSLLVLEQEPTSYSTHIKYVIFIIKTMRYSCLLGDNYKFTANANNKDYKITKIHHFLHGILTFECYIQHSNVATFEGLFECGTFVYALVQCINKIANWCF